MATSLKRMHYAEEEGFQKRVSYYFWAKAQDVIASSAPDVTDLKFAKMVYASQVSKVDMCLTVITNSNVGATIDADEVPTDADIEWTVLTNGQFSALAVAYETAGLM